MITATKVGKADTIIDRWIYALDRETSFSEYRGHPHPIAFDHVVVSWGREGDTGVFASDADGHILDFAQVGYLSTLPYWLPESQHAEFVAVCLARHERSDPGWGSAATWEDDLEAVAS